MPRRRHPKVFAISEAHGTRRGIYLLPNLLTSFGLMLGIYSMIESMQGSYLRAAVAIILAGVFDGLDGRVARLTNSTSRFGVEYDSLCDLVSFGVAPGLMIYGWALEPWGLWGWSAVGLYVICAAIRLARFNIMSAMPDTGYFLGLPVPASATMLSSLVIMYRYVGRSGLPDKHIFLLLITYALALLMVSSIPYPNFKHSQLYRRQPMGAFVGAVVMLTVAVAAWQVFVFTGVSTYVVCGPVLALWAWWKARDEQGEAGDGEGPGLTSSSTAT